MSFIESITVCFKKYFDFKGRASRSEFWYFMLFYYGGTIFLMSMSSILNSDALFGLGLLFYFILGSIPALAVCVRRLHDINKTGFAVFVQLIPFKFGNIGMIFPLHINLPFILFSFATNFVISLIAWSIEKNFTFIPDVMLVLIGPGLTKLIVIFLLFISLEAVIVAEFKDALVEL